MDEYNSAKSILHVKGDYAVHVCEVRDPILESDIFAYGVYNMITRVREAEARRLPNAISICDFLGSPASVDVGALHQMDLPFDTVN